MIDLADGIFFDTDIFAQDATFTHAGVASSIPVIFDNLYSDPQGVGIVGVETSAPMATCKTSDVAGVVRGDTLALTVDGVSVTFKVVEVMSDGTGVTMLRLSRE